MDQSESNSPAGSSADNPNQHAVGMTQVREHGRGRGPDKFNRFKIHL